MKKLISLITILAMLNQGTGVSLMPLAIESKAEALRPMASGLHRGDIDIPTPLTLDFLTSAEIVTTQNGEETGALTGALHQSFIDYFPGPSPMIKRIDDDLKKDSSTTFSFADIEITCFRIKGRDVDNEYLFSISTDGEVIGHGSIGISEIAVGMIAFFRFGIHGGDYIAPGLENFRGRGFGPKALVAIMLICLERRLFDVSIDRIYLYESFRDALAPDEIKKLRLLCKEAGFEEDVLGPFFNLKDVPAKSPSAGKPTLQVWQLPVPVVDDRDTAEIMVTRAYDVELRRILNGIEWPKVNRSLTRSLMKEAMISDILAGVTDYTPYQHIHISLPCMEMVMNGMMHGHGGVARISHIKDDDNSIEFEVELTDTGPGIKDPNPLFSNSLDFLRRRYGLQPTDSNDAPGEHSGGAGFAAMCLFPDGVIIESNGKKWVRVGTDENDMSFQHVGDSDIKEGMGTRTTLTWQAVAKSPSAGQDRAITIGKRLLIGIDDFSPEDREDCMAGKKILAVGLSSKPECDYDCIYCLVGQKHEVSSDSLTLQEQMRIIDQAKALGAKTLVICADGEPLLDAQIIPIIEYAHSKNMRTVIFTNGALLGDDNLSKRIHGFSGMEVTQILYKYGVSLMVKMDSMNETTYEYITQKKGSYAKFQKALSRIREVGFSNCSPEGFTRLSFSTVVMKNNFGELEAMKRFADKLGAQYICKLPALIGNAKDNLEAMFPLSGYARIREILTGYSDKRETLSLEDGCLAWRFGIIFDVYGEVRYCFTLGCPADERIGNIREHSVEKLLAIKYARMSGEDGSTCPAKRAIHATKDTAVGIMGTGRSTGIGQNRLVLLTIDCAA